MSRSRPVNITPHEIVEWFKTEQNPAAIHAFLTHLRQNDYAENLRLKDDDSVICAALTTNDVKSLSERKLKDTVARWKESTKDQVPDPGDIIKIIMMILEIIIKIIEASDACKKKAEKAALRTEIATMIKALGPNNPFANFARAHFTDMDLTGANLQFANFEDAKFNRVKFDNASMTYANLRDATARYVSFRGTDLSSANVCWADLAYTDLDPVVANNVSLKAYLQNNFPSIVKLNDTPSIEAVQQVLSQIEAELEAERLAEHVGSHKFIKKLERHYYHEMVEANVAKIAEKITDPNVGKALMLAVLDHTFFKKHGTASFVREVNSMLTGVHNLFSKHKRETPYFGSATENKIVQYLNVFEKEIEANQKPQITLSRPS